MLEKFTISLERVKSVVIHPSLPWLGCATYDSKIYIWDYNNKIIVDKLTYHEGVVRSIDFHCNQPLLISGGDDQKIEVYNYKTKRKSCTLYGHFDYIRSVHFHKTQPWIVSASDDQTVRIWNWQNSTNLYVLTGHNHYVCCAQFHPSESLIVSCSLDLTIRIWDISALAGHQSLYKGDILSTTDPQVKIIIEGHEKGIHWVSFHPTKPYIVSCSEDKTIRIWKINESYAYEVEQLRGHTGNVYCAYYLNDRVISVSEDRSIRVWDVPTNSIIQTYQREQDRYWSMAVSANKNIIAAGHDSGAQILKMGRERPAMGIKEPYLYFVKGNSLHIYEFNQDKQYQCLSLQNHMYPPKTLSINSNDNTAILSYDYDNGVSELFTIPAPAQLGQSNFVKGYYKSAVFWSGDKFAAIDSKGCVVIRTSRNEIIRTISNIPLQNITALFTASPGNLIIANRSKVILYNVSQQLAVSTLECPSVKQVYWSEDYYYGVLYSKHQLIVCNKKLDIITTIHENDTIKSVCIDSGIHHIYYTTIFHLKYGFIRTGEIHNICTLDEPLYLIKAKGDQMWWINRKGLVKKRLISNTNMLLRMAVQENNIKKIVKLLENQKPIGNSIVQSIYRAGYPQLAMHIAEDPDIRFKLAIESGALHIAKETALQCVSGTDRYYKYWSELATNSIQYGDLHLAQLSATKIADDQRKAILCTITADMEGLSQILNTTQNICTQYQFSVFAENIIDRINLLENSGNLPIAYMVAVQYQLTDKSEELLGKMEFDIASKCKERAQLLSKPLPLPVGKIHKNNWPLLSVQDNTLTRFLNNKKSLFNKGLMKTEDQTTYEGNWGKDDELFSDKDSDDLESIKTPNNGGWGNDLDNISIDDLSDDMNNNKEDYATGKDHTALIPWDPIELYWVNKTSVPAFHIAAGSFKTALNLLKRQIGLKNAAPLKQLFMQIWAQVHIVNPSVITHIPPSLHTATTNFYRLYPSHFDTELKYIPYIPFAEALLNENIQVAYKYVSDGNFNDAISTFTLSLQMALLQVVTSEIELKKLSQIKSICITYVQALRTEIERKVSTDARMLELSCYFTQFKLETNHLILALYFSMKYNYKAGNKAIAASLAHRLLELDPSEDKVKQARIVIQKSDGTDKISLNYQERNPYELCSISRKPLYKGIDKPLYCSYCHSPASISFATHLCPICELGEIGNTSCTGIVHSPIIL